MQPRFVWAYQAAVSNKKQGSITASAAERSSSRTISPPKVDRFTSRITFDASPAMPAKGRRMSDPYDSLKRRDPSQSSRAVMQNLPLIRTAAPR